MLFSKGLHSFIYYSSKGIILFSYFFPSPDAIGLTLYRSCQPRILRDKVSSKQTKNIFGLNRKEPKLNLFRLFSSLFHEIVL